MDEREFISKVGRTYARGSTQDKVIRELIVRTFKPYLNDNMVGLQLGYGEGIDTAGLAKLLRHIDVVECNKQFIRSGRQRRFSNVSFIYSLFEELDRSVTRKTYDVIFAIYVLEHVRDVQQVLSRLHPLLKPQGLLFVVVPNANALSRQLARAMGLLTNLKDLTKYDIQHGHRRVYDMQELVKELEQGGFELVHQGGIFLKILADFQLNKMYEHKILTSEQIEGLYKLGLEYPHWCGSIFAIARSRWTEENPYLKG